MNIEQNEGRIEIIIGPIFSGKSTRLIEVIRKYIYKDKKTVMVKYKEDKRYSEKSEVVTHDLTKYESIECKYLFESFDKLKQYDIIGIDEGQFFPDLVEICQKLVLLKKVVIVAALNADYKMEPFPNVSKLISKADKIKLLKAYCFHCHIDAYFSLRITHNNDTALIENGDAYKPACRNCHIYFSEKEKGILNLIINKTSYENKENKGDINEEDNNIHNIIGINEKERDFINPSIL